jgi:hypothetical protein
MDKFPDAFRRFEQQVSLKNIVSFRQLALATGSWSGPKWIPSQRQIEALADEARKRRLPVQDERERNVRHSIPWISKSIWKFETISVRGKSQQQYRDNKTGALHSFTSNRYSS